VAAIRAAAEARFADVRRDVAARAVQAISERLLDAQQRFGAVRGGAACCCRACC
jgi:hypothetical protein